jgi:uncharacterized repeat protein (TIGR03803 family)
VGDTGVVSTLRAFTGNDGDFDFNLGDGEASGGALTLGGNGRLYGTAPYGGEEGEGVLFELDLDGAFTPLVALTRAFSTPKGVLLGNDGNLYFTYGSGVAKFLLPGAPSTTLLCPSGQSGEQNPDEPSMAPGDAGGANDPEGQQPGSEEDETGAAGAPSGATGGASEAAPSSSSEPAATDAEDDAGLGCALGNAPKGRLTGIGFVAMSIAALASRRRRRSSNDDSSSSNGYTG